MAEETAAAEYPVPTTDEQVAALEKALATHRRSRLKAAEDFMNGKPYANFRVALADLNDAGLPAGSSVEVNAKNLTAFLDTMIRGIEQDIRQAEQVINPAPAIPPVPQLPA